MVFKKSKSPFSLSSCYGAALQVTEGEAPFTAAVLEKKEDLFSAHGYQLYWVEKKKKSNSLQRNSAKSTLWSRKYLMEQITHITFPDFALTNLSITTAHLQHQRDPFCVCLSSATHPTLFSLPVPLWWENTTCKSKTLLRI